MSIYSKVASNKKVNNLITFVRGDTHVIKITFPNPNIPSTNYLLEDGDIVRLTVKSSFNGEIVFQKVVDNSNQNVATGNIVIVIEPEDTENLIELEYKYDVEVVFANGAVKTIIKPPDDDDEYNFILSKDITLPNDR